MIEDDAGTQAADRAHHGTGEHDEANDAHRGTTVIDREDHEYDREHGRHDDARGTRLQNAAEEQYRKDRRGGTDEGADHEQAQAPENETPRGKPAR